MSSLSITVPDFVTVTVPCTTVSVVPGGTPVFVGPGLPGGSGSVGETVGVGVGVGLGVGVAVAVGFGVGFGFGFGLGVGLTVECEADGEEPVAGDADVDEGPVEEPGTTELGMTEPGVLELTADVGAREDAGAAELAGAARCVPLVLVVCSRSIEAATISPPSSTNTSTTISARSRSERCRAMTVRSP